MRALDSAISELARERILLRKHSLGEQLEQDVKVLHAELGASGALHGGARIARLSEIITWHMEAVADATWEELQLALKAQPRRITNALEADLIQFLHAEVKPASAEALMDRHAAGADSKALARAQERVRRSTERVLRQAEADIRLHVLGALARQRTRWYARPGVLPALITSGAVLLAAVMPALVDLPWQLTWRQPSHPDPVPSWQSRAPTAVPESLASQLRHEQELLTFERVSKTLRDSTVTHLGRSTFAVDHEGEAILWPGILVSAREYDLPELGTWISARVCPQSELGSEDPTLISVTFKEDQRHAVARVAEGDGVLVRGVLRFVGPEQSVGVADGILVAKWNR